MGQVRSRGSKVGESIYARLTGWLDGVAARVDPDVVQRARARLAELELDGADAAALAACVADVLAASAVDRSVTRAELVELLELLASDREALDAARELVFTLATRSPIPLLLPPADAAHAELQLLLLLAPIAEASLWAAGTGEPLELVAYAGERPPTRTSRTAARRAIFGGSGPAAAPHVSIHPLPVATGNAVRAALVVRTRPADKARGLRFAEELVGVLELILDRNMLLERTTAAAEPIVEAGERRLRRIGFDLHDGPLQELARLHGDLQLVRSRLISVGLTPELLPVARDLDAVLSLVAGVEGTLRGMSQSLGLPPHLPESFADAVATQAAEVEKLGIECRVQVSGDPEATTPSQRIAVLRIVEEALANACRHSGAGHVRIELEIVHGAVRLEIVDDGSGFDVERVLRAATRRGRLGLAGMRERASLLGGAFAVTSAPGGPTRLTVSLPAWRPAGTPPRMPARPDDENPSPRLASLASPARRTKSSARR